MRIFITQFFFSFFEFVGGMYNNDVYVQYFLLLLCVFFFFFFFVFIYSNIVCFVLVIIIYVFVVCCSCFFFFLLYYLYSAVCCNIIWWANMEIGSISEYICVDKLYISYFSFSYCLSIFFFYKILLCMLYTYKDIRKYIMRGKCTYVHIWLYNLKIGKKKNV